MSKVPNKVKKKLDRQLSDIVYAETEFEAERLKYLNLTNEINENSYDKKYKVQEHQTEIQSSDLCIFQKKEKRFKL